MALAADNKSETISRLQKSILRLQGFQAPEGHGDRVGLGPIEKAFPNGLFPIGGVHEFISKSSEQVAATSGFIGGVLSALMRKGGVCLWIAPSQTVFPPALKTFGVEPDRVIFINIRRQKDITWAMEEALKCGGLAAVVAELCEMDFIQSRRFQLAVEKSRVTGFVLRSGPVKMGATACAARWQIRCLSSELEKGMPGVGFPRWEVELLKVRNGNPGTWRVEWSAGHFIPLAQPLHSRSLSNKRQKTG